MNNDAQTPIIMLHVFPGFGYGGQQARFASLANELGGAFYHHVIALDGDVSARALISSDAPVRYRSFIAKKSSTVSFENIAGFRKLIGETGAQILCTYNWGAIEAVMANRLGAGLGGGLAHLHFEDGFGPGEHVGNQPLRRIIARRLALGASTLVAPSRVLESVAKDIWKLSPGKVHYIQNGVDIARFSTAQKTADPDMITVGTIGALRPEKNFARLLKAFHRAAPSNGRLVITGAGPEGAALMKLAADLAIADRVRFTGATDNPQEAYAAFDIFALSSDTEQAPLTMMEAMAAGLPVVATDVGDIIHMAAQGNKRFITRLGDDAAYAAALAALMQDASLRKTLGAENAQKARREFTLERMVREHRALYEKVAMSSGVS